MRQYIMLARVACRILSLFCAMLYIIVGVQGGGGDKRPRRDYNDGGSERRRITDTLLATVARGYPPMHTIRVSAGSDCKKRKVPVAAGPAGDTAGMLAAGRR